MRDDWIDDLRPGGDRWWRSKEVDAMASSVGRGVGSHIALGDIVVSRLRGPIEAYVICEIYADSVGDWRFRYLSDARSQDTAVRKGYSLRAGQHQVWLFAGPDDQVYSTAREPPH